MSEAPALELLGLRKSYPDAEGRELRIVSVERFVLARGEQAALFGESGSGKTTLLHLVSGILAPDAGVVRVAGEELTALSEAARDRLRARAIGIVFQTFHLLGGYDVLENVLLAQNFGRGEDEAYARELLRRVGLERHLRARPARLSVGQRQRVAVARALANRPALVIADEPTGSLDGANAAAALTLIREACAEVGAALLLVSHDAVVLSAFPRRHALADLASAA
ncbi:MAG: ATP-binding cassette domain-containing protein [Deltaproteobacteria bacterium]|nr:ATP-binding cassette domain-containing protein [Deltaproteobacteria bacterium]